MTPTPKVKKTFPGCKKSFKGFPLNNEDYSGLTYIACIATNIKSNEENAQVNKTPSIFYIKCVGNKEY